MRPDEITIPEPCHEDWNAMDPRARGRFCRSCSKKVHNLSSMTEREARALLSRGADICVAYFEEEGQVTFEPEPVVPLSRLTARRAVAPAAAGLALALAACAPHGDAPAPSRSHDPVEVVMPLPPVIPEAPSPETPPPTVVEDAQVHEQVEDEPCDPTPTQTRPTKGKVRPTRPRMGKPVLPPHTNFEL